jgi:hypothetical protein
MLKKKNVFVIIILIIVGIGIRLYYAHNTGSGQKESVRIGISLYKSDDTFISDLRKSIEEYAKEYERKNKIKIYLEVVDADDNQSTQNRQVERFIALGYDVLCVNPVDRTDTSGIINPAVSNKTPVVFFNRKPMEGDIKRSDNFYYIGSDPKESAVLEGSILLEAYKKDPKILDLNGDGVVNYVLLEGEPGHQDSIVRTEWSIKTLKDGGIPLNKIDGGIANWERTQSSALMEMWLLNYPEQIELVISNNDDMALGAIDAIERLSESRGIKLVGIDGVPAAIQAVNSGKLLGTVAVKKDEYAKAVIEIAVANARNRQIPKEIQERITDDRYYLVGQEILSSLSKDSLYSNN